MTEQPSTPERVQIVVRVLPEVKARYAASALSLSMTQLLERAAAYWETAVLDRLKPEHRTRYLDGTLTFRQAFGKKPRIRKRDASLPNVIMSCEVTVVAREQLRRYSKFTGCSLPDVLGIMSRRLPVLSGGEQGEPLDVLAVMAEAAE
jgi:hypothetical protein